MKNYKKYLGLVAVLVIAVVLTGCGEGNNAQQTADMALSGDVGGVGTWPIIGWIAELFGFLMRGIYLLFSSMNVYSCALCILVFTIVTKMLILPLTIKQQKFSKVSALMNPEIQAIQKKYEGKKDQASMAKMQAEQQAVQQKYGVSMTSGCLSSFIQLPIIFAFYPVIMYFAHYVPELKDATAEIQTSFFTLFGSIDLLTAPSEVLSDFSFDKLWTNFAWLIPILAGALQFLSAKLTSAMTPQTNDSDNPAASSMKTMTYVMPIFSVFICYSLQAYLGVYWIVQSLVMVIQQLIINKQFSKIEVEDIIKENLEKQNKKREKKGLPPISEKAFMNTKNLAEEKKGKTEEELAERDRKIKESTEYYNRSSAAPGSLAAKANMVKEYNEKHNNK